MLLQMMTGEGYVTINNNEKKRYHELWQKKMQIQNTENSLEFL